jgi:serine/threonine protein kinase
MGSVFLAEHKFMERPVAIKVVSRALLDNPDALRRFFAEVRAAAKLAHPNIVAAYDAEPAGDGHLFVMEYVEGVNLAEFLAKNGPLPIAQACRFAHQVAEGLQHAHEQEMVHRDIKPANLMLTPKGQVKILDFGLARLSREGGRRQGQTEAGAFMGTPEYVAPEQATDARTADIRADIYSLGCTLYCLLAGQPPFREGTAIQLVLAHLEKQPPPLRVLRPEVPPALEAVVARALAKDPQHRYQAPLEFARALAPYCKEATLPPPVPARRGNSTPAAVVPPLLQSAAQLQRQALPAPAGSAPVRRPTPRRRRRALWPWFVGAVATVLIVGQTVWLATSRHLANLVPSNPPAEAAASSSSKPKSPEPQEPPPPQRPPQAARPPEDLVFKTGLLREYHGHNGQVWQVAAVALSPDGKLAASGGGQSNPRTDHEVHLWDTKTGNPIHRLRGHSNIIRALAFLPDGKHLLSASWDKSLCMWDTTTGAQVHRFEGHKGPLTSVAVSADGRLAVTGAAGDPLVHVWDLVGEKEQNAWEAGVPGIECLALSLTDDRILVGGVEGTMRVLRLTTGREVIYTRPVTCPLGGVAFTPDGLDLVFGCNPWRPTDTNEGNNLRKVHVAGAEMLTFGGPQAPVKGLAVSADRRYALTGNEDGSIRYWDVNHLKELHRFDALHGPGPIGSVGLSADGRLGISGGSDGIVRLWGFPNPAR